ncbi:MAG TPA: hypothetical protein VNU68_35335 [Verrucomicrobiae bacterium]|nr:hypothetical protein [Verrucomicrobiae bacterium]
MPNSETSNLVRLTVTDGRTENWRFPDGTVVTMTVPIDEPPITVKHAVYCLSSILHQTHRAMEDG